MCLMCYVGWDTYSHSNIWSHSSYGHLHTVKLRIFTVKHLLIDEYKTR